MALWPFYGSPPSRFVGPVRFDNFTITDHVCFLISSSVFFFCVCLQPCRSTPTAPKENVCLANSVAQTGSASTRLYCATGATIAAISATKTNAVSCCWSFDILNNL